MRDLELTLGGHERFLALCALYPTGSLSGPELASLREHLEACDSCRALVAEYRHLNRNVIPLVVEQERQAHVSATGWQPEEARRRLLETLDRSTDEIAARSGLLSRLPIPVPVLGLAALLVIAFAGGMGYLAGFRRGIVLSGRQMVQPQSQAPNSSPDLGRLLTEQRILDAQIKERDGRIESLSTKIAEQSSEIARLKHLLNQTTSDHLQARSELSTKPNQQTGDRAKQESLEAQLKDAQSTLAAFQAQLRQTLDQRTAELMQTATLQRRIDQLNAALNEKDSQIQEQQTLLSSDRDIRELMGARDLFIADVFDIDRDGRTKKPFGRVFYTKNKSLVFYAFDLDKQRDARNKEVAFQAWGLNDADKHHPVSLGIFYMDNQANRRWALRFDDPAVLKRINAVFVTLEPSGGSSKPSGKQLLYAYLQAQANHP